MVRGIPHPGLIAVGRELLEGGGALYTPVSFIYFTVYLCKDEMAFMGVE